MPNLRSEAIRLASQLPKGDPTRVRLLEALSKDAAGNLHRDPNVGLSSRIDKAEKEFSEDTVRLILRYSSLPTPLKGKPGSVGMHRNEAYGNLVHREMGPGVGLRVSVKVVSGKIHVEMSDLNDRIKKKFVFTSFETPASIAANVSWFGTELLLGQATR